MTLEFLFNDSGEVSGVYSPGRYREVRGEYILTLWAGQFGLYEEKSGMRVPTEGEGAGQLPEGTLPYWKGRIVEIEYDFAQPEFSGQGHA